MIAEKTDFWTARIGQAVDATNYRGCTATGRLLGVQAGVWGYGGDAVALKLDVKDDDGSEFWPAEKCGVAAVQPSQGQHPNPTQGVTSTLEDESLDASMRAAFEAT